MAVRYFFANFAAHNHFKKSKNMKRIITALLVAASVAANAQTVELTDGVYEIKKVVTVDSVPANQLYTRALEALSDWAGSQTQSKAQIDVQDKDEGLVVYKGQLYLGLAKVNFMHGWQTLADFTMKVRCKDGRFQITTTVPSLSMYWTADETSTTIPLREIVPKYTHKSNLTVKKSSIKMAPMVPDVASVATESIISRIKKGSDDDF